MSNKVYVGNMNYRTTEDGLRNLFAAYGEVSSVNVIIDRQTGRSKGFAFVEMTESDSANAAIEALNDKDFEGRKLKVNLALPKEGGGRGEGRSFERRDYYTC